MKADTFNPDATITRQQATLMIYRAMQYHVGTVDKNGVRNIAPSKTLTRGYIAKILNGTLKYLGH